MNHSLNDISVRHLRYVLMIAEAGSVTAAAERLHVAQPSMSQQLRKLEQRLGTPLFERTRTGLVPTVQAREFLANVSLLVANLEQAAHALSSTSTPWRTGVGMSLGAEVVARAEAAIRRHEADARLILSSAPSSDIIRSIRHGTLDLGLVRAPVLNRVLVETSIVTHELGIVVGPDHPLTLGGPVTWNALRCMRLLWFSSEWAPGYSAYVLDHLAAHGWNPELEEGPDRLVVFQHRLMSDASLVALRPRGATAANPPLRWLPFADDPPLEHIVLIATAGTRAARVIHSLEQNS
ncbi:LysR family transcriptional regulator [Rathayibacter toxicus]|uniref:LysR family transcriptional regulator n=1 Tax=Rathayibacter toxicus TaxID=145458 RepID=A0A0U1PRE9_9MICO|nr:LysR family transcriptional regulator [Rathayibacter toxicus]ALS57938.1 hypothetical protein APU90_09335 [Rathayibacter toxicus]KKM44344.1 hypothetical protein VT73_10690 [Rathayibacter toxicus]PPG20378.1 LysR family transcriptional regulator [Rathayibacter toxicus]PPG45479.1 LysR family transcriptional regulator [Rathayibacter toxicus]PPH22579.1 LysR family transcriptional regulator [Rathayibacter toxicus]